MLATTSPPRIVFTGSLSIPRGEAKRRLRRAGGITAGTGNLHDTIDLLGFMTPTAQIAHYRVTSKLGEGGMGAVYRATDTKLNREVAIKILPKDFAGDPDRFARFTREAQVLASLNHPNIASIYGVEEHALILELIEGPTLAESVPPHHPLNSLGGGSLSGLRPTCRQLRQGHNRHGDGHAATGRQAEGA
jgi:serine/threonine protein kinase